MLWLLSSTPNLGPVHDPGGHPPSAIILVAGGAGGVVEPWYWLRGLKTAVGARWRDADGVFGLEERGFGGFGDEERERCRTGDEARTGIFAASSQSSVHPRQAHLGALFGRPQGAGSRPRGNGGDLAVA